MRADVHKTVALLRSGELAERYAPWVSVQKHPAADLVVLNYTRETQYAGMWDEVTLCCRGLIVDTRTFEVAAWPFVKFFNVHERPETAPEALPQEPFAVYEKMDGSLGLSFRGPEGLALASRGSFTSEQAVRGTALLRQLAGLDAIPDQLTLLFEIIYPENKSVIRYGFTGLVLLAGFDRRTGEELTWEAVQGWAGRLGCRTPRVYPFTTLAEVLESRAALPGDLEGYVVRFASGFRVKLKGDAYLTLHKLVWGLSEKRVLETLTAGAYEAFLREVPEEFRPEVEALAARFHEEAGLLRAEAERWFAEAPRGTDRKTFALWVQARVPPRLRGPLFQLLDGREPNWYRLIDRTGGESP
jgi:RNA ligase